MDRCSFKPPNDRPVFLWEDEAHYFTTEQDAAVGANSQSSVTEVEEDSCPPKEFIGLRNGGRKNNYIVEGILFQSGRLWKRDQRWVVRKFRQR